MNLGHVQSAHGYGWEAAVGRKTYWFGRGLSGRLLGAFSSVIDLFDAFDEETGKAHPSTLRCDPAEDRRMTAEAVLPASPDGRWGVHVLKIDGKIVGYCVDTPDGVVEGIYGDLHLATARAADAAGLK
ncbi:MAG TPA: hypothetical protein VGV37_28940 [Aliidongia sp.]|uniref:hypothetical protein n=1 Tax=Aliidongia sp. TaxID=1914230 RepID=UPI002DDD7379|nr:hypothetical protein [Aliidongia sp.]HEV2678588.1 hypothetical protein [Aliidongia sp.]